MPKGRSGLKAMWPSETEHPGRKRSRCCHVKVEGRNSPGHGESAGRKRLTGVRTGSDQRSSVSHSLSLSLSSSPSHKGRVRPPGRSGPPVCYGFFFLSLSLSARLEESGGTVVGRNPPLTHACRIFRPPPPPTRFSQCSAARRIRRLRHAEEQQPIPPRTKTTHFVHVASVAAPRGLHERLSRNLATEVALRPPSSLFPGPTRRVSPV